jgi:Tfp pilus assembly pilus retraction ATPase PilT
MAALINFINTRESRHILTLENPIEFCIATCSRQ